MWSFLYARRLFCLIGLFSLVALVACGSPDDADVAENTITLPATWTPLPSATPPLAPTAVATPEVNEAAASDEEAILILQPGPGSRIVNNPFQVTGMADPAFEQTLVVRLLLADGTELAVVPTILQAGIGERGSFAVEVPFTISGEQQAFVQVYTTSARDGGLTHVSSVGLTLADSGEEHIVAVEPHPERIQISQPALGETITGGTVTVAGEGLASFEQTLVVDLLDEAGQVLDTQPVTVDAPDFGQMGSFSVELTYTLDSTVPGRVVVRDMSPAFGGEVHLRSVEVSLAP